MRTRTDLCYATPYVGLAFSRIDLFLALALGTVRRVDTAAVDLPSAMQSRLVISSSTAAFFTNL